MTLRVFLNITDVKMDTWNKHDSGEILKISMSESWVYFTEWTNLKLLHQLEQLKYLIFISIQLLGTLLKMTRFPFRDRYPFKIGLIMPTIFIWHFMCFYLNTLNGMEKLMQIPCFAFTWRKKGRIYIADLHTPL